jgi:hypothetical protein
MLAETLQQMKQDGNCRNIPITLTMPGIRDSECNRLGCPDESSRHSIGSARGAIP